MQIRQVFSVNPGAPGHFHQGTPWPEPGQWGIHVGLHVNASCSGQLSDNVRFKAEI